MKKDDNFWSDFLTRSQSASYIRVVDCQNRNLNLNNRRYLDSSDDSIDFASLGSDKNEYQKRVFKRIFGKQFEARAVDTLKKLPDKSAATYHFCQK